MSYSDGMVTSEGERWPYQVTSARALGTAIRHYRLELGLTQAELARRAHLPRETLSRLENGHETEQLRHILALLRQLGVRASLERVVEDEDHA
jgi:transcriptional regulator with XRE-family HTH domain